MDSLLKYLPLRFSHLLAHQSDVFLRSINEIRLREALPFSVGIGNDIFTFGKNGELLTSVDGIICTREDLECCLDQLCASSLYSFEETIKKGYIPLSNGCRAGVCGEFGAFVEGASFRRITAINIRVSHLKKEFGRKLCAFYQKNGVQDTLIVSPPALGKTTLLRSVATLLSEGVLGKPIKTAIVDERSEIYVSGMTKGLVDVISGCPKSFGIELLTRTMSPEVIICDEISHLECDAIRNSRGSGVVFIASLHAPSIEIALSRPFVRSLIDGGVFNTLVVIGSEFSYDIVPKSEL